ncbi:bi-domain-containing oxidoreductase [Mucilaginibacter sp.]|jgi:predicted dehydrogenase/threonine dehydrogenase-like Zn-dependent dehydrogenase|uniref:bi-domain-containing oxidoreductase n=1 Tax=Mucilaginibacter sp. TaxID=1882438 RepID=UPI002BFDB244|nr:bi-domain-containing oxidoreductase [Mucilaginibacter sp.]HTI60640.1 bi-domain-containing oxidoreductase [Mucilaginibacter sp.]
MKQIIQSFKTGETILEDIPAPLVSRGNVLIKTTRSLVSLGTERMLVEFGKANLVQKARQQPDKVKQVLDKIKTEGLAPTLEAVFNKLGQPLPLGYCNVGKVIAVGDGVSEFKIGDRVTSNGPHAEFVNVPKNLVAAIPDNVTDEEAAFTVIGSIGLQGIRLCAPTLGETIVVFGLGLIGLLTAELLVSNGCRVIGIDLDAQKIEVARKKGIIAINPREGEDVVKSVMNQTGDIGADGVIITASAKTDDIISQAAQMSRKRGRIILVGVIGLNISRAEFYEKELTFQVSCSYGPGRYDESYEQSGIDYPLQFVRWTEKRNFQTILQAISAGKLDVKSLITERVSLDNYKDIYDNISNKGSIASILEYPESSDASNTVVLRSAGFDSPGTGIGIIGAGNFTKMTMLPALEKAGAAIVSIASAGGVTGTALAKKHNISKSTTDYKEILTDQSVGLVMITTRHNQHASMVKQALAAGKHVFVEKPLALNNDELNEIITSYDGTKSLTVGFNRRFSPHIQKIKQLVGNTQMNIIATMNAGHIPPNVWVHDMNVGGGRIIGEACHFIDLITFLTGSKVKAVMMNSMGTNPQENTDNATILLKYENGSTGVINYFANGSKEYSKERVEVYSQERTAIMDNYRVTQGYGFKGFSKLKTTLDKGHKEQFKLLAERVKSGGAALIPFDEIINTTKASFAAIQSLKEGAWVVVN